MGQIFQWPKRLPDPDKNSKTEGLTPFERNCRGWAIALLVLAVAILAVCLFNSSIVSVSTNGWRGATFVVLGLWTSAMALWNARVMTALTCGGFFLAAMLIWLSFF